MAAMIIATALVILAAGEQARAGERDGDPVEALLHFAGEKPSTYFFVGYDDCVERLRLPNANPEQYCRERFPRASAQLQHSARK